MVAHLLFTRELFLASLLVALAYLGENLYAPVAGVVAQQFGRSAASAHIFISAAFYGSALAGVLILLFAHRVGLKLYVAGSLILGAAINLAALAVPGWTEAVVLRVVAGLCFGGAVGGAVILLAQSSHGALLAGRISVMFSLVFLVIGPSMLVSPYLEASLGLFGMALGHALLCVLSGICLGISRFKSPRRSASSLRSIVGALPRIFWSDRKTAAFGVHAASLYAALAIIIGTQPALAQHDLTEFHVGLVLATFSGVTVVGGLVHAWMVRRLRVVTARWAVMGAQSFMLVVALLLRVTGHDDAALAAAFALAAKCICGGPPSFEALLYDLGPRDPVAAGLQRSLGMIIAIALTTLTLSAAHWLGTDVQLTFIAALGLALAFQILAFGFAICRFFPRIVSRPRVSEDVDIRAVELG